MTELVPAATPDHGAAVSFLPSEHVAARVWRLAERIARTEFVPGSLRGKPDAILAAMLTGREVGIGAMHSLRAIDVIDGRPSLSPELLHALTLRAGHDLDVEESTRSGCTVAVHRTDWPADRVRRVTFDEVDARLAGLVGPDCAPAEGRHVNDRETRSGNATCACKQGYRTYPRAMYRARAIAEAARTHLPDVVERIGYTAEEFGGEDPSHADAVETVRQIAGDEVAAEVAAALEEDDEDDPDGGTPAETDPTPDPDTDGDVVDAEIVEDAEDPRAAELAAELNRQGAIDAHPDDPFDGLSSTEQAAAAEESRTEARQGAPVPTQTGDALVERYGDLNVTQVATLVRTGDVELDDGTVLELPPALDGIALLAELERRTGDTFRKTVRATLEGALEKLNVRPDDWPAIIAGPTTTDEDAPGSPETPAEGEGTVPAYNAPREAPTGAPAPPPLPEGDDVEARRELLRRWKAAHRETAAVDEAEARKALSSRLGLGLGDDAVWAKAPIESCRRAVIDVERARSRVLPF